MSEAVIVSAPLNLQKSAPLVLEKGYVNIAVECGWDSATGQEVDLDLSVFITDANGKYLEVSDVCYYGNQGAAGQLFHAALGDDRDGSNSDSRDDDVDERIDLRLAKMRDDRHAVQVVVTAHNNPGVPERDRIKLSDARNAFVRLRDMDTGEVIQGSNFMVTGLTGEGVHMCTLERFEGGYRFVAVGELEATGLAGFTSKFGY